MSQSSIYQPHYSFRVPPVMPPKSPAKPADAKEYVSLYDEASHAAPHCTAQRERIVSEIPANLGDKWLKLIAKERAKRRPEQRPPHVSPKVQARMKAVRIVILTAIAANPGQRAKRICELTGIPRGTIGAHLSKLYFDGHLSQIGLCHLHKYTITPLGEQWMEKNQ